MMNSLLPPNATLLEHALERGSLVAGLDPPADIDDPYACPAWVLPWLAWGLSVDTWDADWSEADKRAAVAGSIDLHRRKGTRLSVETILARFDQLARIVEWHEATPRALPHTFEIILPIAADGVVAGGTRATAAFAEAIVREVHRVKPLREHFVLVQGLDAVAGIGVQAVARSVVTMREEMQLVVDSSQPWAALLQDENGEPLDDDTGNYLDTTP